jgi:RHS repeat-associated protein
VRETDPLGKATQYQYDAVNNLITKIDRNDRRTDFTYDDLNRVLKEIWVGTDQAINYSYDKASNLTAVTDKYRALAYSYNNRDRRLSENNTGTPNSPSVVLNYRYDAAGNLISMADTINGVTGGTNAYSYDALNRLGQLTQSGNNISDKRVNFAYNVLGQYTSVDRYSDLTGTQLVNRTNYSYDNLNRLTSLGHSNGTDNVAFYNYVYDAASRITQITDVDGVTDYTYDNRSQLTGANHGDSNNPDESYTYDANGNRTNSSVHGDGYQTGTGNRLTSDGTYNYEYDNEGNLSKQTEIATGKVQELTWDYRNRLVAIVDKDAAGNETQRVEFTYDALNRRIAKAVDTNPQDTTAAIVTQFVYDGEDVLLEFVDSDGVAGANQPVLTQRYWHGAGVDQVLAQESAGNVVWQLTDHLGTVRDLVNNSGAVVNHFVYDSYGQVISETNPAVGTRYLFTGREFDQEIGLYYYRARYYDATNGRFISLDPINIGSGTVNLYSYVGGNPISFVDMFGNKRCSGNARVLQGNKGLIGKEGAFSGNKKYPVTDDSAAILIEQFGKSKADLRPDIDNISGKIGDPKNPICTFNKVRDRIDDNDARNKSKKTPYEMWKERSPGNFIVELPGIDKDLGVQPIELSVPDTYPCPEGTSEVK